MRRHFVAASVLALLLVVPSLGASIVVGKNPLLPDMAGQKVDIYITGGDVDIAGTNFRVQIADGFPGLLPDFPFGSINGPDITGVDIVTGTLFAGGDPTTGLAGEQAWEETVTTTSGTVAANGKVATVWIDTTGFFLTDSVTSWALNLTGMVFGDTEILDDGGLTISSVLIENGSIYLTPEPLVLSHLLVVVSTCAVAFWFQRRRKQAALLSR